MTNYHLPTTNNLIRIKITLCIRRTPMFDRRNSRKISNSNFSSSKPNLSSLKCNPPSNRSRLKIITYNKQIRHYFNKMLNYHNKYCQKIKNLLSLKNSSKNSSNNSHLRTSSKTVNNLLSLYRLKTKLYFRDKFRTLTECIFFINFSNILEQ